MNQVLVYMLVWGGLILFGIFITNMIALGIPGKVLSVRASMGRKVLVQIRTMTGFYYRTGKIDGDFLIIRARGDKRSEKRRIDIANAERLLNGRPVLFRAFGVVNVCIDEATNAVLSIDMQGIQPHDAIKVDHLIKRALMAPKIQDKKDLIIIVLLIVTILILLYVAFKTGSNSKLLVQIASQVNQTATASHLPVEATITAG